MFHREETKFQNWRALAVFEDGSACLLYLGRSTAQIRAGYAAAFAEVLEVDERARVREIAMQCWQGAADQGGWLTKTSLSIPAGKPAPRPVKGEEPSPVILPFRREVAATG